MSDVLVRVESVSKAKGRRARSWVLDDITLSIARGEAVGLLGANGSGKTTLARLIAGLDSPDKGSISVDGEDPSALLRRDRRRLSSLIAMVPQEQTQCIDPLMTVDRVLREPFALRGEHCPRPRLAETLAQVGLEEELLSRRGVQLSTGQRQRVALARTLVGQPLLLILDEATSALDQTALLLVVNLLKARRQTLQAPAMLVIEHNPETIKSLVDRTITISGGKLACTA